MKTYPFALYDAFSDTAFGGSQAGVVFEAGTIDADTRLRIAQELALPAVCFVSTFGENSVTARFQSAKREYPMCGHGTICLMTHMLETGRLNWKDHNRIDVSLNLPTTNADVEIHRRKDGRSLVMLDIRAPEFYRDKLDIQQLAGFLGLTTSDLDHNLPVETASGDFVHLVVPVKNLAVMRSITPDFSGLTQFCIDHGFETIACFCSQVEQPGHDIHVRDFCPAVGVPESAAAGTTNAALSSYLIRHQQVQENEGGEIIITAEQGLEIKRPSTILSTVSLKDGRITRLQVGGVATKVLDGHLTLPATPA